MGRKLREQGYDAEIVSGVLRRLLDEKLLDDGRYVSNFVAYHAERGHGPLRVSAKLRKLGMSGELVEPHVSAFPDWVASAERARLKKFGALRPTELADKHRQARFLAARGFMGAQIHAALGLDSEIELHEEPI